MTPLDPLPIAHQLIAGIQRGAFLTVKAGEHQNVMTIGWSLVGFLWQRPVLMVPVRNSRHTYSILEQAKDFTVSIPSGDMREALHVCGTRSGHDLDKFAACHLTLRPSSPTLVSPVLDMAGTHLECTIRHRAPMDPRLMDPALEDLYPQRDHHTLYFGEIQGCYATE